VNETAGCHSECFEDPVTQQIRERIATITGIPEINQEYIQLLRYEVGQYYNTHSDYIPHQQNRPAGVRVLTFFMYLSDVDEGGNTSFPNMNITVVPKKGRAILWPSVLDEDPNAGDSRTDHEALPVVAGIKHGANVWIHQRDYRTPNQNACD
jgi:prolyl 4-hydroxylase